MTVHTLHSYRAQVETAPATDQHQVPQIVVVGLKARSMGHAIACARAVFAQPVRAIYRQDRAA